MAYFALNTSALSLPSKTLNAPSKVCKSGHCPATAGPTAASTNPKIAKAHRIAVLPWNAGEPYQRLRRRQNVTCGHRARGESQAARDTLHWLPGTGVEWCGREDSNLHGLPR